MSERQGREMPARLLWPPITFLIFGLLITMGATLTLAETSRSRAALRFAASTVETRSAIEERLQVHISLLRGAAALYASGAPVDQEVFRRYVQRLNLARNYPGVQGIGFAERVSAQEREVYALQRTEGVSEFTVWPESEQDESFVIVQLVPLDERNRVALGFDMFSEPTRRDAMLRARDNAQAASTGAVTLVQEIDKQHQQTGFLIYLPVYEGGVVPETLSERREHILGFAYSPFRTEDLFRGIFGNQPGLPVAFTIYDGLVPSPEAVLHRSTHLGGKGYTPALTLTETIKVAGRPWTIVYASQPAFDASGDAYVAPLAALTGVLLSLILFAVAWGQARARHEAELAVHARETFLSVASHELKTPLTALFGNAQLLQRRAARNVQLGERERVNVDVIVEQARRLNKLIEDLLDHTRLQEGRLEIKREPLDLGELVLRVADELRPSLTRHVLTVTLPDRPLTVLGDDARLEQVLFNLITNAVKYSPAGGAVEVTARCDGPCAIVTVADHGIGIPAAALPQLFSPFFRAPNAVSKQIGGMGIGLYVVKELVERHGGAIALESQEGVGSTFAVSLPLAAHPEALNVPSHQQDPRARQRP